MKRETSRLTKSRFLHLPPEILRQTNWKLGKRLELIVEDGALRIKASIRRT